MLGPQDVGFRVVVRHIVGTRDGRPLFTDLLGELLTFTDVELTVDSSRGPMTVPLRAVVAGKRIPPRGGPSGAPRDAA
jgi:N-acetylglutamate synthase